MRTVLAFAIFIAGLSAQPKPARVEGTITNSVTGAPVKKAEVSMQGQKTARLSTVSDAAGHFAFENVAPGEYFTQLSCPGFTSPLGLSGTKRIAVAAGDDVRSVSLQLMPFSVISGRVLDEDGDPIVNATVFSQHYVYRVGRRLLEAQSSKTNDLGEFRIIDVPPGRYYLQAKIPTAANIVYYPNGRDFAQAASLEVKPGSELASIDFHFKKLPSFHVRGKLIDAQTGKPPKNAWVQQVVRVGPEGDFDIPDMAPGTHELHATTATAEGSGREIITITDHDLDDVRMVLQAPVNITGSVIEKPSGSIRLTLAYQLPLGSRTNSATVNDNGSFEFRGVPPELYTLMVGGVSHPGKYLKSVQFAGREIADGTIDLRQGLTGELVLAFGSDGGQIRGTTNAQVWATAALASDTIRPDQFHMTGSDAEGNFGFQDLAPGRYKVMAWGGGNPDAPKIAELRALLSSKAVDVTVTAGGMQSVQLNVISPEEIAEALQKLP